MTKKTNKRGDRRGNLDNFGDKRNVWKPGQSGNPKGRPRKWISQLAKDNGYTLLQIKDTMKQMLAMSVKELDEIVKDKRDSTALERAVAMSLKKAAQYGDMFRLEAVITRPFGGPTQVIEEDKHVTVQFKEPPRKK